MGRESPNILWICTDQQRYDTIHALGNRAIHTPNLDRLCREGTAFTRAYCQSPICTPSRASFMSGFYPSAIHVNSNGNAFFPDGVELITKRLADIGYVCGMSGKLHLASAFAGREKRTEDGFTVMHYSHGPYSDLDNDYLSSLKTQGWNLEALLVPVREDASGIKHYAYPSDIDVRCHQTTWCVQKAVEFMDAHRNGPWCFCLNIFDPHPPFDAPESYSRHYPAEAIPKPLFRESDMSIQASLKNVYFQKYVGAPDSGVLRSKSAYYGMIELIDEQIGRVLAWLEAADMLGDTLIIYTSDHGDAMGDHGLMQKGCRFYEGLVHVPLIWSWPAVVRSAAQCHELVELADIAPTLAELCGIQFEGKHGKSLVPLLRQPPSGRQSPTGPHKDFVRSEYYHALPYGQRYEPGSGGTDFATMLFDGRYKVVVYHGIEQGELYDLETDPGEFDNLWSDPGSAGRRFAMTKQLFDDCILRGDPGPAIIGKY